VAETLKNTTAPLELVAATVILLEQTTFIGGLVTITWNEQLLVCPHVSLAVTNTVLVPIGKVLPLGGVAMTLGVLQPPVALTLKKTTAPFEQVAVVVMLVEHVRLMGGFVDGLTITWKEQLFV
jgi:hypothetical protein